MRGRSTGSEAQAVVDMEIGSRLPSPLAASTPRRTRRPPRRAIPTRAGLVTLASPIILGVAAVNATNNLLFILLGAILGAVVLSGVLSERNLRGLRVQIRALAPPYAGEPARLLVALERPLSLASEPAFALGVRELAEGGWGAYLRRLPGGLFVGIPLVEGMRADRIGFRTFDRRGPARLGDCELTTRHPFGLLTKARDVDVTLEVLVRPRRVSCPEALSDPARLNGEGDAAERRGNGFELYGLREREDRDALHRIHGLRSLSLGRDVVIETAEVERPVAWLGIANTLEASPEALERALELAQATLVEWDMRGYAIGLATAASEIAPGERSLDGLLDHVAGLGIEIFGPLARRSTLWLVPAGASAPEGATAAAEVDTDGQVRLRPSPGGPAG